MVILIHILAITLLISLNENNVSGSQKLLLKALCVTELIYATIDIALVCCFFLDVVIVLPTTLIAMNSGVSFFYVFIMTMIPIDRFMAIYLNIKYSIYWSPKKTKTILIGAGVICFFSSITLFIEELWNPLSTEKIILYFILPIFYLTFIIIVSFSYFYITKQVLRHQRDSARFRRQLQGECRTSNLKQSKNKFKLLGPTLVILTFILFMVSSYIIRLLTNIGYISFIGYPIAYMLVPVGFLADAMIYVFNLNAVRVEFTNIFRRHSSVHPESCVTKKLHKPEYSQQRVLSSQYIWYFWCEIKSCLKRKPEFYRKCCLYQHLLNCSRRKVWNFENFK